MGGPSAESKANEAAQADFYKAMVTQQQQTFTQRQDVLDRIKEVTEPILAGGMNQYGFTQPEEQLLESTITDAGSQATSNAVAAQKLRDTQASMGGDVMPAGASSEKELIANEVGEQQTATNIGNLKLQGFQTGRENFLTALNALSGTAALQSPTEAASAATGAGTASTDATKLADSERSTLVSSILGGAITGGLNLATGGAFKALGVKPYGG